MTCAIFGNNMEFQVVTTGSKPDADACYGSALQNSDIHRAHIGALLRGGAKTEKTKGGRNFWRGFMAAQAEQCANSNGAGAA